VNLFKAASTVSLLTLASRVTGQVREMLMASVFGANAMTDAFNVAFRLPNMFRRLFAEGAFSQAFVPVLGTTRAREGDARTHALVDHVASVLVAHIRAGDLAVRTGGDEFAVVLERCPPEAAQRVAGEVQRAISRAELQWEGHVLTVGASVGVAPLSDEFPSVEAWVAAADAACYAAKAAGRGTVRLARPGLSNVIPLPRQPSGS
jgi:hypothetical protein